VVHYYWLVKSDVRKPVMYGTIIGLLLVFRLGAWFVNKRRGAPTRGARTEELVTAETP
jgi:DMSO/TMAO reductase YedYZ heme-binding membrane subunit